MTDLKKAQRELFWFGLLKIPMIGFSKPKIVELSKEKIVLKIKLKRKTRNHVKSLYIACFTIGADLATGFLAFYIARKLKLRVTPIFKSFQAQYLKRAEDDVYFVCEAGSSIVSMINASKESGERENLMVKVDAVTDYYKNPEKVANLAIELSMKVK